LCDVGLKGCNVGANMVCVVGTNCHYLIVLQVLTTCHDIIGVIVLMPYLLPLVGIIKVLTTRTEFATIEAW